MRQPILLLLISFLTTNLLVGASLRWDRTEVNLDMEPEQEEIRASFKVTNEGDERVRIARISSSCGCTGSVIDRRIIEPGGTTEIAATFNRGKRQGLNRNRLQVFIDDHEQAVATLHMNVRIPQLIEVTPRVLYWNPTSSQTERRVTIQLDQRYVDEIQKIEYDRDQLELIAEEDATGRATRVLRIAPKSYDELYRGKVTVTASGPDGRTAEAVVHTFVQP